MDKCRSSDITNLRAPLFASRLKASKMRKEWEQNKYSLTDSQWNVSKSHEFRQQTNMKVFFVSNTCKMSPKSILLQRTNFKTLSAYTRKVALRFVISVGPHFQYGNQWTDFHEILYWGFRETLLTITNSFKI
jgi:hypothetical protein